MSKFIDKVIRLITKILGVASYTRGEKKFIILAKNVIILNVN